MLQNTTAETLAEQPLDALADAIQRIACRLEALSKAADDLIDFTVESRRDRTALDHASSLLSLAQELGASLRVHGEAIEIAAMQHKREAA